MAKKISKKAIGAANEYLDLVGQENEEKAAKWVIETQDQAKKVEDDIKNDQLQQLTDARKRKFEYLMAMVDISKQRFAMIDWPSGSKWEVGIKDDDKLHLMFRVKNKVYGRGIKCTGIQHYDLNAINILAVQAENTIDSIVSPAKTDSGIYLK